VVKEKGFVLKYEKSKIQKKKDTVRPAEHQV